MSKKINRALIQGILSKGDGVKTISSEAVDWCIAVAEVAAKNLADSGRRTPGGRLMAPRMDPHLMARYLARAPEEIAGVAVAPGGAMVGGEVAVDAEWGPYHEWQQAVRTGATKLKFEEWKKEKGK